MADVPAGRSTPSRERATRAVRTSDVLLRTLYVGTAMLGLLITPPVVVLLLVPALAAATVVLLAAFLWYLEQRWPSRRTLTTAGTATAGLVPFGHAVHALEAVGSVISLTVLTLLTVVCVGWLAQQPAAAAGPHGGPGAGDEGSLRELLQVVPLETLLAEWRALDDVTGERPGRDPAAAATDRAVLLDELQRRDPEGFAAWLAAGATRPPDEHLRDDRGLAA